MLAQGVKDLYDQAGSRVMAKYHEVFSILKNEIEEFSTVYIVIDALDELPKSNDFTDGFIEALSTIKSANSRKVRILATARSQQPLLSQANNIKIVANEDDVKLFVESRFQEGISISSQQLSNRARDDKDLRTVLVDKISKQAGELFLLARLFVDTLNYKTSVRGLRDAVEQLPRSINEQYRETWKRIEEQNPDPRALACRILSWVAHAARPLQVLELRHALATTKGETSLDVERLEAEDALLPCCHGLVAIDGKPQIIRLVHYSAQEYLDEQGSILFPDAQTDMLSTCLTYLSFKHFEDGRWTFESYDPRSVNEVANGKRIAKRRFLPHRLAQFPFLQYAASNWGRHAAGKVEISHQSEILAFLQNPNLLESATQAHDSDLLYSWPRSDAAANDSRRNLPLFVAGSFGLNHIAAILIDRLDGFDVNTGYGSNKTLLLHQAVESGNIGLTGVLLGAGADPRLLEDGSVTGADHSALYKAIAHERTDIVKMLLRYDQDDLLGPSEIYCATFRENTTVIQSILAHLGGGKKFRERLHQFLFHAACLGRTSIIEFVLQMGADLEAKDDHGQTALCLAVKHGRVAAVGLLLDFKAITTVRDMAGSSLLQISVRSHEVIEERLRFVRDHGRYYAGIPEPSGVPCSMEKPMIYDGPFMQSLKVCFEDYTDAELQQRPQAFRRVLYDDEDQAKILETLLRHGGNVNEQDCEGVTLLHSVAKSTPQRARALLETSLGSLTIDPVDKDGRTPLHYAAAMGSASIMKFLLKNGAIFTATDNHQATTLHFGVMSPACTKLSIERGALVDAQDIFHRTPLHYAVLVEEPNRVVRKLLLDAGASLTKEDSLRKSAQYYIDHWGIESGDHLDVPEWLECHMLYLACPAMSYGSLYGALENSLYYGNRISEQWSNKIGVSLQTSAQKEKRWSVVSDSDEEDYKP
ncbi:MAG: hypothetical protein Q9169_002231 [Polycauliona sp. 2 TL-2023]